MPARADLALTVHGVAATRRPTRRDLAVAAGTALPDAVLFVGGTPLLGLGTPTTAAAVALVAGSAALALVALLWRRQAPLAVVAVLSVHAVVGALLLPCRPTLPLLVALASLVAQRGLAVGAVGLAASAPAVVLWIVAERRTTFAGASLPLYLAGVATYVAVVAGVVALGLWHGRSLRRGHQLEQARRRAVVEERRLVARELHDIVAHALTVMVIQAAGARAVLGRDPARAAAALGDIEAAGVGAVDELRRLLVMLREAGVAEDDDGQVAAPSPGLARVPDLVDGVRSSGRAVTVRLAAGVPLAASVDAAAFRVVQESLTNALKHSGDGPIELCVTPQDGRLRIEVVSPAAAAGPRRSVLPSTGAGLAGLAERVALVGGRLEAGPDDRLRWVVRADLPVVTGA